jgi:hypothetical protein
MLRGSPAHEVIELWAPIAIEVNDFTVQYG